MSLLDKISAQENTEGWGPTINETSFSEHTYTPFNQQEKIGRVSDWTQIATKRQQQNVQSAVGYVHHEDDSFNLVLSKKPTFVARKYKPVQKRFVRYNVKPQQQRSGHAQKPKKTSAQKRRAAYKTRGRYQSRFQYRTQKASVNVKPDWTQEQQWTFQQLSKLQVNIPAVETIKQFGTIHAYDRKFDLITTKTQVPVVNYNKTFLNVSTTDDVILRELAQSEESGEGYQVFATDKILSVLMAATKSVYSWDIVIDKVGNCIFLDKRPTSDLDSLSVNESAREQPPNDDSINSAAALAEEATVLNQKFSQQVLKKGEVLKLGEPNPLIDKEESPEQVAPVGYLYRKWTFEDNITVYARCEVDGYMTTFDDQPSYVSIKALNEYDGGWRQKLDTQRGSVLITELKNNSAKVGRWTVQALLAGVGKLKLGFISRIHPANKNAHTIIGVETLDPQVFSKQVDMSQFNMWGIFRAIIDTVTNLDDGKYLLLKEPNQSVLKLYSVPEDAFDEEENLEESESVITDVTE